MQFIIANHDIVFSQTRTDGAWSMFVEYLRSDGDAARLGREPVYVKIRIDSRFPFSVEEEPLEQDCKSSAMNDELIRKRDRNNAAIEKARSAAVDHLKFYTDQIGIDKLDDYIWFQEPLRVASNSFRNQSTHGDPKWAATIEFNKIVSNVGNLAVTAGIRAVDDRNVCRDFFDALVPGNFTLKQIFEKVAAWEHSVIARSAVGTVPAGGTPARVTLKSNGTQLKVDGDVEINGELIVKGETLTAAGADLSDAASEVVKLADRLETKDRFAAKMPANSNPAAIRGVLQLKLKKPSYKMPVAAQTFDECSVQHVLGLLKHSNFDLAAFGRPHGFKYSENAVTWRYPGKDDDDDTRLMADFTAVEQLTPAVAKNLREYFKRKMA